MTLEQAVSLINEGKILHIAADESLLSQLPKGNWIGGTTPYFIAEEGGTYTKEKLFINEIDFAEEIKIAVYGKYNFYKCEFRWGYCLSNTIDMNKIANTVPYCSTDSGR